VFVYAFGCVPVAYGGDPERAIQWGRQALQLSPLDTMSGVPQGIIGFSNFLLDRHEEAVLACQSAIDLNPRFSVLHGLSWRQDGAAGAL
jgi:hypothetical protein